MYPAKIPRKSPGLGNSEGTTQNERDLTLKVSSTVEVGEVLGQLVQEIKEMRPNYSVSVPILHFRAKC